MRTKQIAAQPCKSVPAVDADERTAQRFINRVNRQFQALSRSLNTQRKLAVLVFARELDSEGFVEDLILGAAPGETPRRTMGLA
jgi:hypothetical protein